VWRSHFGQTVGSGSTLPSAASQSVVPEPSTVVLLILAAASALVMPNRVCRERCRVDVFALPLGVLQDCVRDQ
jgi:hypothetical protein